MCYVLSKVSLQLHVKSYQFSKAISIFLQGELSLVCCWKHLLCHESPIQNHSIIDLLRKAVKKIHKKMHNFL